MMENHHLLFQVFGAGCSGCVLRYRSASAKGKQGGCNVPFRFALNALAPHLFRTCFFSSLFILAYTSSGTSHFHFSRPCGIAADGEVFFFGDDVRFFGAIFRD